MHTLGQRRPQATGGSIRKLYSGASLRGGVRTSGSGAVTTCSRGRDQVPTRAFIWTSSSARVRPPGVVLFASIQLLSAMA